MITAPRLRDIPKLERDGSNLHAFAEAVREALQTFRGYRGDPLDKALTLRAVGGGALIGAPGVGAGGGAGAGSGTGDDGADEPDPTPPPTPTGLIVTAGISHIYVQCDTPAYVVGHGHQSTIVYGAKQAPDDLTAPVFSDAVELFRYEGAFGAYPSDPATRWRIWIKWLSMDGEESTDPAGGANGAQAITGQDVRTLLDALSASAANAASPYSRVSFRADQFYIQPQANFSQEAAPGSASVGQLWYRPSTNTTMRWDGDSWESFGVSTPFFVQTTPTTINGVTVPAGVYMDGAFVYDLTAAIARLGEAWIDSAMVAEMSADKLTAGTLRVGAYIQSANFEQGADGWRIRADGTAELDSTAIRGTLTAAQLRADIFKTDNIHTRGMTVRDADGNIILSAGINLSAARVSGLGAFAGLNAITGANIGTYIEVAAIKSAYIGNLEVKSANIDNLTVGTQKLASGSISQVVVSDSAGVSSNSTAGLTKTTTVTLGSIVTSANGDGKIMLLFSPDQSGSSEGRKAPPYLGKGRINVLAGGTGSDIYLRVKRNGTTIRTRSFGFSGNVDRDLIDANVVLFDVPGAGVTAVYEFEVYTVSTNTGDPTNVINHHEILPMTTAIVEFRK